jgi:hypothetical protein
MADDTESLGDKDPAVEKEENRLRKRFSATDETTFTIKQPSLDDDDIEVVAVTFTVPSSALLEKLVVSKATARTRKDSFFGDEQKDGGHADGGDLLA